MIEWTGISVRLDVESEKSGENHSWGFSDWEVGKTELVALDWGKEIMHEQVLEGPWTVYFWIC